MANVNQRVKFNKAGNIAHEGTLYGIRSNEIYLANTTIHRNTSVPISDCQLILRDITQMTEEENKVLLKDVTLQNPNWNINYNLDIDFVQMHIMFDFQEIYITNEYGDTDLRFDYTRIPITMQHILYLFSIGIAYTPELFTNGVAVKG